MLSKKHVGCICAEKCKRFRFLIEIFVKALEEQWRQWMTSTVEIQQKSKKAVNFQEMKI